MRSFLGPSLKLKSRYIHSSLEYFDRCRHLLPYRITKIVIGAMQRLAAAKTVIPQPQSNLSTSGPIANGRKVPIKHLVTMSAVMAEAEYSPKASTMYDINGKKPSKSVMPRKATRRSSTNNGARSWAAQPYKVTTMGRANPPMMHKGRRYSGFPWPWFDSRSRMYILSKARLHVNTDIAAPTPASR